MNNRNIIDLIKLLYRNATIYGKISELKELRDLFLEEQNVFFENRTDKNKKNIIKILEKFRNIVYRIDNTENNPETIRELVIFYNKNLSEIEDYIKEIEKFEDDLVKYTEKLIEYGVEDDVIFDLINTEVDNTGVNKGGSIGGGGDENDMENEDKKIKSTRKNIEKDIEFINNNKELIEDLEDISIISKRIVNFHNEYTELKNREDENIVDYLFGLVKIPQYKEDYVELDKIFDNTLIKNKNYRYLNNNGDGRSLEKYNKIIDEILKEYDIFKKERKNKIQNLKLDEIENRLIKEYYDPATKRVMQAKFKKIKDKFLKKEDKNTKIIDAFLKKLKENIKGDFDIFNNKLKSYESEKNKKNLDVNNHRKKKEKEIMKELQAELTSLNNQLNKNDNFSTEITEFSKKIQSNDFDKLMEEYSKIKIDIVEKLQREYENKVQNNSKTDEDRKNTSDDNEEDIKKIILELKKFIENLYSNVKKGENLIREHGDNVNIKAIPDIYQDLYNKFIEKKNTISQDNSPENLKEMNKLYDDFLKEAEVYGLNQKDVIKITVTDKLLFMLIILVIKTVALTVLEYLVEYDYIDRITLLIVIYGVIYTVLYILVIILINISGIKMKLFFGYFNTDINITLLTLHIVLLLAFILITYLIAFNFDEMKLETPKDDSSGMRENEKVVLLNRVEVITNVILLFSLGLLFLS
jgi:hypothetical protein